MSGYSYDPPGVVRMRLYEAALLADDVLKAAAGNVEGVANEGVDVTDALAIDGDGFDGRNRHLQVYAQGVFVPVAVRCVDERANLARVADELTEPVRFLAHETVERRRMPQAMKSHLAEGSSHDGG